ncbi:TOBE-like domain-containing protein [Pleurocapsales cyanobacterium LEGE 06147]|nr:TOBE-like domain-containing protein [Pleurocapsales cyanobacterium LEGE 06147]
MSIVVERVSKKFGNFQALEDININVESGKLVALLGPSGSGKSTLLRTIAGLEIPDTGSIVINGQDTTYLDIRKRNIGFVFQHYALFKHLTVRQNIAFGLEIRKTPRQAIKRKVDELIELVQLRGLGDRYPNQLSGGQRQRVGLARALAVDPQVLLLDEPFGALDAKVRKELRDWVRRLHDEVHLTSIFVTHDQEEAMAVADEIVVMNHGRIEQIGSPDEVYENPATPFVMSFVGEVNVLRNARSLLSNAYLSSSSSPVYIRPHDIDIDTFPHPGSVSTMLVRIIPIGWEIQLELQIEENFTIAAQINREQLNQLDLQVGQQVYLKPRNVKSFPEFAHSSQQHFTSVNVK